MKASFLLLCLTVISHAVGLPYGSAPFSTMQKEELMAIIKCLVNHPRYYLCEDFASCEKYMPEKIQRVYERCQRKLIGGGLQECNPSHPLFSSSETPPRMFDCITDNVEEELKSEERKKMADFEQCVRSLWNKYCAPSRRHVY